MSDGTKLILMTEASEYDKREYGIKFKSAHIYRMTGRNTSRDPHRLQIWDNTVNPNIGPHYGPDAPGAFGVGRIGEGAYVSPKRKGTDSPESFLWSRECTVIDAYRTGTGTRESGQVWAETPLAVGDTVALVFPNGETSGLFTIHSTFYETSLVPVTE